MIDDFLNSKITIQDLEEIFQWKSELLLNGLRISSQFYLEMKQKGMDFYKGRQGGAGPAGGRYFLFENGSPANVSLYGHQSEQSYLVLEKFLDEDSLNPGNYYVKIKNERTGQYFQKIRLIPIWTQYNEEANLDDTINKQIALIHGTEVLASTIIQRCKYWRTGEKCGFCGIELSLKNKGTIEKKTGEQLNNSIESAQNLGLCRHITLTAGTLDTPDKGALYYVETVKKIKTKYPDLPIHIQIEPFEPIKLLSELKDAGVSTIGIHLEIPDDNIREQICPGKFKIRKEIFEKFWRKSLEIFGRGQVTSFILIGFGEDIQKTINYLKFMVKMGVVPIIVPVRQMIGTQINNQSSKDILMDVYNKVSKTMLEIHLDPFAVKAGCARCMGCSALNDAYIMNFKKNLIHYSEINN